MLDAFYFRTSKRLVYSFFSYWTAQFIFDNCVQGDRHAVTRCYCLVNIVATHNSRETCCERSIRYKQPFVTLFHCCVKSSTIIGPDLAIFNMIKNEIKKIKNKCDDLHAIIALIQSKLQSQWPCKSAWITFHRIQGNFLYKIR